MKRNQLLSGPFCAALVLLAGVGASAGAFQAGPDVMAKLGVPTADATAGMLDALAAGSAYNEAAITFFKALPASARAGVVRESLSWIRARVSSADFKTAYAKRREAEKPKPPEAGGTADDLVKKQKAEMEKSIAEMEKTMAGLDPAMKKTMQDAIQTMRKQMAEMEKPEIKGLLKQGLESEAAAGRMSYEQKLKEWEEKFPSDPRVLIARRIRQFLEVSRDVDYSARLVPAGAKMRFENAGYEAKPKTWKLCFRAGREATEAARTFAASWLAELGK